jgi:hypothetical protein
MLLRNIPILTKLTKKKKILNNQINYMNEIILPGDSGDYELLTRGIAETSHLGGLTCEIGLRRGGGTKVIMDTLSLLKQNGQGIRTHIAIDPYGHIPYEHKEGQVVQLDYTNEMRDECLMNLYAYSRLHGIPFIFFNLEDTEFFKRFGDGVPTYNVEKKIINLYSFVHFDGPHATRPLQDEINFFLPRMQPGACWVFDDVVGYYNHDEIEEYILENGWELVVKKHHKALYCYKSEF